MLTLNLISREQKKEIKLHYFYGLIKKTSLILIIIITIITIIFLIAKIIIQIQFNKIVEQTTLVTKNSQSYNSKIREINNKLNFVSKIQDDFIPWSDLIKNVMNITPSDINFYYFKLNVDEKTIKIKGIAKLRNSLLDFKTKMQAIPELKDIDFPIKNILEKENIDFEINCKLNK